VRNCLRYVAAHCRACLPRATNAASAPAASGKNVVTFRTAARCLYCLGPLPNGAAVCFESSDKGWWAVPTTDGELYEPA
jgi:hypothetical protein